MGIAHFKKAKCPVLDPSGDDSKARGSKRNPAVRRNQKLPYASCAFSATIGATTNR